MAGRLAWFHSTAGRRFAFGCMSAASVGAFAMQYFPHTFLLSKYQDIVALYESAVQAPLSEELNKRWNEALRDLSLPEHEVKFIKPFMVFGFDMFHAGTIASRWGGIVGIPSNFTYTDVSTVDTTPIRVNNDSVNWNRQDAKNLLESLVLSENAQLYGIAREILLVRHNEPLVFSFLGSFAVSSTYVFCRLMNSKYQLLDKPFLFRSFFYIVGCLMSYGVWVTQKDILNNMWEREADEHLAQLDKRYTKGAIEYCNKTLQRNVALRTLLGADGENVYTPSGNERHLFRQPRIPIQTRKEFFESNIAETSRKMESLTEDNTVPAPA